MNGEFDPMVLVAANRQVVRLRDGRVGRLIFWSTHGESMTVYREGRHYKYKKQDLLGVLEAPDLEEAEC